MKMLLDYIQLIYGIHALICPFDVDISIDSDADLLAICHIKQVNSLDHQKKQLALVNRLELQYFMKQLSWFEPLDMIETLPAFL
jgi:hypothetical protein